MIYTCYEMIRDCRAGRAEGWRYFVSNYVPAIRKLLARYSHGGAADGEVLERVLAALRKPGSPLFQSLEPAPERWFVAELRQSVLGQLGSTAAEMEIELETVAAALEPLTLVEKQAAWLETMAYSSQETGVLLRMAPATVEKIREKAAELVRGKVDAWRRTLLAENGAALGRAAAAAAGAECLPAKTFLDVLDGRTTWRGREEMEQHVTRCWHCIDHFCRMAEVVELLRGAQPLDGPEAEPYYKLLGIEAEKRPAWKRLFGSGA
ncbi:MAG: hypothetical protein LAP87_08055 [Acidobacteriia bacterium]|nr:hypothetical protein [Terriglobia bacterium]